MSNGLCSDNCSKSGYAVAITQNENCWCSNYVPSDTVSLSDCSTNCPGYPYEKCGGDGLYGYVVVGQVSGTQGANTASSTTSTTSSTSPTTTSTTSTSPTTTSTTSNSPTTSSSPTTTSTEAPTTSAHAATLTTQVRVTTQVSETVKVTQTYMVSDAADSSTSASSSPSSDSNNDSSSSSASQSVQVTTIYSVKTVNTGEETQLVRTEYVTTIPSAAPSLTSAASSASSSSDGAVPENKSSNSFFDSKGKVAGTFTAVGIVVVGLVSGILYCCCCCRGGKHDDDFTDEENQYSSDELSITNEKPAVPATFYSNQSKNSSPQVSTHLKRNSSSKSILSLFSPATNGNSGVGRTSSKKKLNPLKHVRSDLNSNMNDGAMMFPISEFDTRLDPNSMFLNTNESTKTLGDEQDYSRRVLQITNPE